jgi:hypothetical protein
LVLFVARATSGAGQKDGRALITGETPGWNLVKSTLIEEEQSKMDVMPQRRDEARKKERKPNWRRQESHDDAGNKQP